MGVKTLTITYQAPQETLQGVPTTLPTSEPASPQVAYTVASGDLPALSLTVSSKVYVAVLHAAGKFVTAGTLSWRTKKNGASQWQSSGAVAANRFWTLAAYFYDVSVGDVLEIALWSNQVNSNWDYDAYALNVSRIIAFAVDTLLADFTYLQTPRPVLTLGNPLVNMVSNVSFVHNGYLTGSKGGSGPFKYNYIYAMNDLAGSNWGLFRTISGDASYTNTGLLNTHATNRPCYNQATVPTQITFIPLRRSASIPPILRP